MLKVYDENGFNILSYENKINKDNKYFCPVCKENVIFVDAIEKIKHFRHKIESDCYSEPETKEHIEMKKFFIDKLKLKENEIEVNLGWAIPDLYIEKERVAIEVQYSPLSYNKFIERTENYTNNDIYVLWIFHNKLLKENVSNYLRKAHELYFGRNYIYFNNMVKKGIYPVHFDGKGRIKTTQYGEEYFKYYKNKKISNIGNKIINFNFLKQVNNFRDNYFKIARFYDKKWW